MDILNFSPPKTISYPFFCNPRALYTSNRNTPFHKNTFSFYLTTSTSRKFQTLAHFRRPTNRRNSLRNKLLHEHQVRIIHIPNDPSSVSSKHVEEIDDASFVELEKLKKSELLGENVLLNKLDDWVDQYRKDIDFWGIGSAPIFTVYQDSFGGVMRVLVDEDEMLKRVGGNEIEDKILEAKKLAREMESGENVIARNSSVAKFVVQDEQEKGDFVKAVRGFIVQPGLVPKLSGVGGIVLCVFVVMFGVKKLFSFGDKEVRYTEMEKKIMIRKAKARKEKEMLTKGAVEVIHKSTETPVIGVKKPELDKEQLKNNILKAKASSDKLVVQNSSGEVRTGSMDMDYKVREIREMARQAREVEGRDRSLVSNDMEKDDSVIGKSSNESEVIKENSKQDGGLSNRQNEVASKTTDSNGILHTTSDDITENVDISIEHEIVRDDSEIGKEEIKINDVAMTPKDREDNKSSRTPINGSFMTNKSSVNKKPRIIRSVKEAKDYLSKKHDKENPDAKSGIELGKENMADSKPSEFVVFNDQKKKNLETNTIMSRSDTLNGLSYSKPDKNVSEDSIQKEREKNPTKNECSKDSGTEPRLEDLQKFETALDRQVNDIGSQASLPEEKSFDEVEPTIKQIRNDDTLNMKSDPLLDLNPCEDSDQKDKKFGPTKIGDVKDSGVEPGVTNLQISETTSDRQVNGIGSKASLSEEKSFDEFEPTIKQIRNDDTLNMKSDPLPDLNPSEDSDQKDKKSGPTKIGDIKDSGVEPGVANLQISETTSDRQVNGIGSKASLSEEKSFDEFEPTIKQIRNDDTLNMKSDPLPDLNPSEDSDQKDKKFGPTKIGDIKDSGVEPGVANLQISETTSDRQVNGIGSKASLSEEKSFDEFEPTIKQIRNGDTLNMKSDSRPDLNPSEDYDQKDKKFGPTKIGDIKDSGVEPGVANLQNSETNTDHEVNGDSRKKRFSGKTENWLEKNFHEVEPIIKKIRAGFRDNYALAKERVDQPLDIPTEMESIGVGEDGGEFDWMQDDHLRDIVFRVRDNELCGREPFYLMNDEDKDAFFRGLEKKVDIENKKLSHLHEWLHSNIENIDYGADGISIYDSPEKIIPRWKGPSVEKIPEALNEFLDKKRKTTSTRNLSPVKKDGKDSAKKSSDSSSKVKVDGSIGPMKKSKNPKTVVEGSDGSVKAGKKSGKEYWQHTKKWSQEFLDCYNAETDPEVKSVMKDIGKDLDRWITEKEIEEAADLMSKLPERNRSFVEKKIKKLKREMELFGPQAVVSKYREYADDKEEDYLWWLDLPYVLCIEVYKVDDGEERVGFYSLEMAPDLELEPKPYHVIAFQDPGDCKNLCYIMQAHMDMLGGGNAFVVARPPKDAFRDAKENGFGVTVIKKGELQLNIDQPLEEVEEEITEIGSKMYHDKITKDRSVDINSIMKGVFGFNGSAKRSKRKLK